MVRTARWPLRRPPWAAAAAAGVAAAAVVSVWLACGPHAAGRWLLAPAAGWLCISGLWRGERGQACLELHPLHGWILRRGTARQRLRLLRAWPAFGWVRLRFAAPAPAGSKENMLELTVWKSSVPADDWRRLRVLAVGQPVWPARPAGGGAS